MKKIYYILIACMVSVSCQNNNDFGSHERGVGEIIFHEGNMFHFDMTLTGGYGDDVNLGGFYTVFMVNDEGWNDFFETGAGVDLYRFGIGTSQPLDRDYRNESGYLSAPYIVPNAYAPADINGQTLTNINGEEISVSSDGMQVTYNGQTATILKSVQASNGYLYQIDKPFMPTITESTSIAGFINSNSELNLFSEAMGRAIVPSLGKYQYVRDSIPLYDTLTETIAAVPLEEALDGGYGGFTVYALDNQAMSTFLANKGVPTVADLTQATVDSLMLRYVFPGQLNDDAIDDTQVSIDGSKVQIKDYLIKVNNIDELNIRTLTGRIHIFSELP